MNKKRQQGFTLIEILIVIGIIAVIAAIVLIALNPQRQFQQANDSQRWSDVNAILNAMHQYGVDQHGDYSGVTAIGAVTMGTCGVADTPIGTDAGNLDFGSILVSIYIAGIPTDPSGGDAGDTGYDICQSANNRFTVKAPDAQIEATIEVTR